ncbi:hypothetical protein, partial [Acinetobacter baumannii]
MTIQTVNLGTAPTGAGGDTFRSTGAKMNENFTNNAHAASRLVGTQAGNVMEVGAFGLGLKVVPKMAESTVGMNVLGKPIQFCRIGYDHGLFMRGDVDGVWGSFVMIPIHAGEGGMRYKRARIDPTPDGVLEANWVRIYDTNNTTVDSNGFIKAASPVVKLFADKIELNEEAAEQPLSFEKLGIGHYLVKGSSGFAKEGWWIEIPTDTHGNKICAVEYQTLENGDLEIKTFKKKLNEEGDIVANLDAPIDIPNNANGEPRWIDIRLNSIKKTIVRKVPRTEKQPRMVQQVKYAPQLTYITKYED